MEGEINGGGVNHPPNRARERDLLGNTGPGVAYPRIQPEAETGTPSVHHTLTSAAPYILKNSCTQKITINNKDINGILLLWSCSLSVVNNEPLV